MATTYERRWETRRGGTRSVSDETRESYYGLAVIHRPHWKWLIISYFFLGGISGASYAIATIAHLVGGPDGRRITRAGRYLSLAALIPSPILLILDLGRPERFHHMLRILKLRSPMSVGTWVLTIFGGFCGLSTLIQAAEDGLLGQATTIARLLRNLPAGTIGAVGSVFGFLLAGYTGILLAMTAVPLWLKNYLLMGPLFLASAMSNATAAITLVLALARGTSHRTLNRLQRLDLIALTVELGLLLAARINLGPVLARPLSEGRLGQIYRWGVLGVGITGPLALLASSVLLRGKGAARMLEALAAAMALAGGFMFRYLMVMAGRASADDPQSTFEFTGRNGEQ
jgi:formate-dependent nitrite reductase membrane component NrfD